jgi:type IV secretory pathway VirB4 component
MENSIEIKNASRRNVLTDGLTATYPFISNTIFDDNGILFGTNLYNDSLILINRFDKEKYKNANMCVFGTSGAGKSFFTKLMILRYRLIGVEQYIIDPEREYIDLCENLDGVFIKLGPSSNTYVNILDIREDSIEEESGYLQTKLSKLKGFFKLAIDDLNEEEWSILEEKIIETYAKKEITFDDKTLYSSSNENFSIKPKFKNHTQMPILGDLYEILKEDKRCNKISLKLKPFINGSLSFFNNYTNVILENKLIVADIYELGEENIKFGMYIFTELFWDKIKRSRNVNKIIYMDEIWRLIGVTSNRDVASFIYKIFKTIRKYGGSSVAITQDISDLFSLDEGNFGKSILNNSSIKSFFSLEEENIMTLEKFMSISEKEKIEIKSLKKGECLMFAGDNHILCKVEADNNEIQVIESS